MGGIGNGDHGISHSQVAPSEGTELVALLDGHLWDGGCLGMAHDPGHSFEKKMEALREDTVHHLMVALQSDETTWRSYIFLLGRVLTAHSHGHDAYRYPKVF